MQAKRVTFVKRWSNMDDDSFPYVTIKERLPREVWAKLYKAGAIQKVGNEDDYGWHDWAYDEQKATEILKQLGYEVVSSQESMRQTILTRLTEKIRDQPEAFAKKAFPDIETGMFIKNYITAAGHHVIKVHQVLDEKVVTVEAENAKVGVKAEVTATVSLVIASESESHWNSIPHQYTGKYVVVKIDDDNVYFAQVRE